jgi:DNA polymerase-1
VLEEIRPLMFSDRITVVGQNTKFDLKTLRKYYGEPTTSTPADLIVLQHILDENMMSYDLMALIRKHYPGVSYAKLGSKGVENFSFGKAAKYSLQDCRYEWTLWTRLTRILSKYPELERLFYEYMAPVYAAYMDIEWNGVHVDRAEMALQRKEKEKEIRNILEELIVDYGAPRDFNYNANEQVANLLYKKHRAPVRLRTEKTGAPSTAKEALEKIAEDPDPKRAKAAGCARLLLKYGEEQKVLGTYLIGIPHMLDPEDRLHPNYVLHGTATGRTSCREPNIQNQPRGSAMRSMYYAPPGYLFLVGDYDQVELRFIGADSGDPALTDLFVSGKDIHRGTAALVLNKPFDEVSDDERQDFGKMPNFLLGYGGGAFNLSQKTGITEEHAQWVMDQYYRAYNRIDPWKDALLREARSRARFETRDGRRVMTHAPYVETMLGRRRRLPELFWNDRRAIRRAERQGVNSRVQGSCSEILKLGITRVFNYANENGVYMKMAIEVHDELVTLVREDEAEELLPIYRELMGDIVVPHTGERPLRDIPLIASVGISDRWEKKK